jgi:serine phosphatase RsbU (regulator of sigma subunit)
MSMRLSHHRLSTTEDRLAVINRFASLVLDTSSQEEVVWLIAKNAIADLGFVDCVVYLKDSSKKYLYQAAAHGPKNPVALDIYNPITIEIGQGIVGTVALTGLAEVVGNTALDDRYIVDDDMRLSEIAVPIKQGSEVIGVIDSEHPEAHFYTEADLEILTTIASMAASKLVQLNYLNELQKHTDELEHLVEKRTRQLKSSLQELEKQKQELTIKNKETYDSLAYAHQIQKAMLPSDEKIKKILPNHFLYFKPKDMVSGDFYWVQRVEHLIYIAVGDCTGHGVPGALLSVLGTFALNSSPKEKQQPKPSEVLAHVLGVYNETFHKNREQQINDGLAIGVSIFNTQTHELSFAGSEIALLLISKDQHIKIKGNKFSSLKDFSAKNFQNHHLKISPETYAVMCTDGVKDQFGGPQNKKLKSTGKIQLIKNAIAEKPESISQEISNQIDLWKGANDQTDDITIFGWGV